MASAMYSLGSYIFKLNTAVPRAVKRSTDFTWSQQERLNRSPAQQSVGYGTDAINFNGVLFPCSENGKTAKEQLSKMRLEAAKMQPLMLVDGDGYVYGRWVIKKVTEDRAHLWSDSCPRRINFSLSMAYYGEDGEGVYNTKRFAGS